MKLLIYSKTDTGKTGKLKNQLKKTPNYFLVWGLFFTFAPMTKSKTYWNDLMDSFIVGYIDAYDCVHSIKIHCDDDKADHTHLSLFGPCLKGWRWDYGRGIDFSVFSDRVDGDDCDRVRQHLTDVYGIQWMENGYHDIYHFMEMMDKEDKK